VQNEARPKAADGENGSINYEIAKREKWQCGQENSEAVSSPTTSLERPEIKQSMRNMSHN